MTNNENRKYWDKICAIPHYAFLLSPDGQRIVKTPDLGAWIDRNEAQKVVDAAQDEINRLREELNKLKAIQQPVAWQFYSDGKWWNGDDTIKDHRKNTEEAGYPVRDLYPSVQPSVSVLVDALENIVEYWNRDQSSEAMSDALYHIIETAEDALFEFHNQGWARNDN